MNTNILIALANQIVANFWAKPKTFSTGSTGFSAGGKFVTPDGKKYQVTMNIVEIGSKPAAK